MTDTSLINSLLRVGWRVAVTTMGSRGRSAELAAVDKNTATRVSSFAAECARAWLGCMMGFSLLPTSVPAGRRAKIRNCTGIPSTGASAPSVACPHPRGTSVHVCEDRYPGLQVLTCRLPQAFAQWPIDTPTLAYRCGDSTGMMLHEHAPVSRLTAAAKLHCGTLHDLSRDPRSAEARSITSLRTRRLRDYETKRRCRHKPP